MPFALRTVPRRSFAAALIGLGIAAASAAPYLPKSDGEVVERLPLRASDEPARQLAALRTQWRRDPTDVAAAVRLADAYIDQAAAEGDPRYIGYAQAALQHWWRANDPPAAVRVKRAIVLQYDHRFDDALADLNAAVQADPEDAQAWAWMTAIHLVRTDIERASQACERLAELTPDLVGAACQAQLAALSGRATQAATVLRAALLDDPQADPALRLWALTRLAETEERRGDAAAAERAYRDALALRMPDVYLLAAYADFLLDNGRANEVLPLLKDHARADVLLLRLAIAARLANDPRRDAWARELAARFEAARARGDTTHRKEESRFALAVQGDAPRALELARANYQQQREVADARILLEAALAARQPAAAQPVLDWMKRSGVESPVLHALAGQLRDLK
jgi:Tfp pilus assembly protein PilF